MCLQYSSTLKYLYIQSTLVIYFVQKYKLKMNEIKTKFKCTGLDNVPSKFTSFPEPQNVTLFGNTVFADVIS